MAQQTSGHTIEDIYKAVISDVISQVKEAFLDENIDIDVLHQLKKEWEDKVNASGCVDMEGTRQLRTPDTQPVLPPPTFKIGGPWNPPPREPPTFMRVQEPSDSAASIERPAQCQRPQGQVVNSSITSLSQQPNEGNGSHQQMRQIIRVPLQGQSVARIAQQGQQPLPEGARHIAQGGQQFIVVSQQGQPLGPQTLGAVPRLPAGAVFPAQLGGQGGPISISAGQAQALLPQMSYPLPGGQQGVGQPRLQPFFFSNQPGTQPVYLPVSANGTPLMNSNPNIRAPVTQSGSSRPLDTTTVHQLDGAVQLDGEGADDPSSSSGIVIEAKDVKYVKLNKRQMKKLAEKMSKMLVTQLDGGGGGMTDSSSEDEEEEDPLQTFVNKIDEGGEEGDEQVREEEPLNSDDDQSDDEDLETLFDADDVVMCQFEKVHRARQKWKFSLKDGVMQIHGKDYVFSKCSGEAEW
ncbi:hypothetical protein QR680_005597 [Steinernema hermaphroditum]|uniref:Uncharacterized protein n=1 Tax=Steinernema hermaphroditum TaxID=289476 RepID=A0AA39HTX4_9BILA|nr:hypothetical protein QR680_005597 [Steinernema hermaphroditum]